MLEASGAQQGAATLGKGVLEAANQLPYRPRDPQRYRPQIGLIGCGNITKEHLTAYRAAEYRVTALCDVLPDRARKRKTEFYPRARVYRDYRELLRRKEIEVVDIATHTAERAAIIEEALLAGKHVLSQKPFVLDLDTGQRLADLADRQGVKLAVNQNARWAPHFSYLLQAARAGLLGQITAAHFAVHWNHNWVQGSQFEQIDHLILFDFGIHWFDILTCLMGQTEPRRVYATATRSSGQLVRPPLLAQVLVEYDGAQASLVFDGDTRFGPLDITFVTGTAGTFISQGPSFRYQTVELTTKDGQFRPVLEGCWFPDGFHGTMGELLCAIEENRQPSISARENLRSLALCFAAVASAESRQAVQPGSVRRLLN